MADIYLATRDSSGYHKNDIIDVLEDNQYGGREAKSPDFFVVRIPGEMSDLRYLRDSILDENYDIVTKRKYSIDYVSVLGKQRVDEISASQEWIVDEVSLNDVTEKS